MPQRKKRRKEVEQVLRQLGLGDEFQRLVQLAVIRGWSIEEFETRLVRTKKFQRMFPGAVSRGGDIADFLIGQGARDLPGAIGLYNQLRVAWEDKLRGTGLALTKNRLKMLVKGGVSPDELFIRVNAILKVKSDPDYMDKVNEIRAAAGLKPLKGIGEAFRFAARAAPRKVYDILEAADLRAAGLDIGTQEALRVAKQLGTPGAFTDVRALVREVMKIKPDIGPELDREGIRDADLLLVAEGGRPELVPKLEQLVAQRRQLGQPTGFQQGRRGPGGGAAFRPEEAPLAAE